MTLLRIANILNCKFTKSRNQDKLGEMAEHGHDRTFGPGRAIAPGCNKLKDFDMSDRRRIDA